MAKPKSVKLRSLLMLRTLFKYSDANHPIDWEEMNQHLRPYALDCNRRSMNDTIENLEGFGIKISRNTSKFTCRVWFEDRPLSDSDISYLTFALTTNPYVSPKLAATLLKKMKPFVTVYQEPMLSDNVVLTRKDDEDDSQWRIYTAIQEACSKNLKIQYTKNLLKYDKDKKSVAMEQSVPIWFSPRCFYSVGHELYMVGFQRACLVPHAVNLKDIASVRVPSKPVPIKNEQQAVTISDLLSNVSVPGECYAMVYQGPVIFRCRGSYLQHLYHRFGPPSSPIKKNSCSIIIYPVENVTLSSEDLYWLSQIPGLGIRIIGPKAAVEAVREYYKKNSEGLLDPSFLSVG
ncbi:MAG: hypothetical protein J6J12_08855 [Oscillospiraceae bacterium]|nr:hypothetical protein [Oscillospiraceae bacterium]